ncbi:hypothetical protein LOTGIDRAFT_166273 [Lottia gigantea]|uniref:GON domain-containing protein n=1 Tax=Lottia gigantea TaxID=225164 RepID=V4A308_LOTGI|nr:hypothetical protein LOTGIDRAFT_166273 [Lottia gigantea]ESO87691.1 hypothetical protein LOTGIDRAFT_166273 [Lottia gigantea]
MLGICKNHRCANNTMCKAGNSDYYCEPIGCNGLPPVENINVTSFTSQVLWGFGDMLNYICMQTFYTDTNVTCLSSGNWSEFSCNNIQWCSHTRVCSVSETTEFWLRRRESTEYQKIYCSDTAGPAVTLLHNNMASTPAYIRDPNSCALIPASDPSALGMGYTDFEKIRIKLYRNSALYENDYTNSTYEFQNFGRAGDCYAGNDSSVCGVIGRFIINTRGTGLRVKSTVQWKTWGNNGVMNITRSEDGHVIEGYCGGNCGGCEPDGVILFEVDHNDAPPIESAVWPICKFPL